MIMRERMLALVQGQELDRVPFVIYENSLSAAQERAGLPRTAWNGERVPLFQRAVSVDADIGDGPTVAHVSKMSKTLGETGRA
jgi:hypothetical protein